MTAPSLSNLLIENLRGAVTPFTLAFEKGRKLTIIYGENGSGKSTISDAFDLLGNGNVGSLEKRGVGGGTRPYWPSVGKAHSDVKVELETSAGKCTVSLSKTGVTIDNAELKPLVAVLRRSQILNLITAQPADRYKEISKFVDVSGFEASETALRKLIADKTKDYDTATTRLGANKTTVENFWNQAGSPSPDAFTWANAEVKKDQKELEQRKAAIEALIANWDKIVSYPNKWSELTSRCKAAEEESVRANAALSAITSETAEDYLEVMDILKAAQRHFTTHPHPAICPLCESGDKAENLVAEVNRRIETQGLHIKLDEAKNFAFNQAAAELRERQRLEDFQQTAANDFEALKCCCEASTELADLDLPILTPPSEPEKWNDWVNTNKVKYEGWKQAAEACVDQKNFVEALRRALNDYEESYTTAKDLAAIRPRLDQILEIIESGRKAYTDAILSAISKRVGELYEAIHPGEGLNKVVLALDAAKRGSLEISSEFGGKKDAPPQAYFSDSHLDTLGLCVFFALTELESPEQKILVLDDVLGSVDEPHVERIIGMIYDVSQKFRHTIVTTHYRPWREKFRWGTLKPDQVCHFVELNQWTFVKGMATSGAILSEISRLKTLLADSNPDVQAICGKAGVILEALLDFITLHYGCAVPRKHGNVFELRSLLDSVNGKLLNLLKVETLNGGSVVATTEIKPILGEIGTIVQARNVIGAHFNPAAFDLYPADGIRFATLVEQLSDALVCPDYGRPMKDTGSYWRNGGDTRRLHPLKKPG